MTNLPPRCGSAAAAVDARRGVDAGAGGDRHDDADRAARIARGILCAAPAVASSANATQIRILAAPIAILPGCRAMLAWSCAQCNGGIVNRRRHGHASAPTRRGAVDASPRFRASGLRSASRHAGLHAVLAAERQGDLHHRPARRRAAPVAASAGQRHLRLSAGERQSALDRPAAGRPAAHGRPRRAVSRIRLERQGAVGAQACRPAPRFPPPAERQHALPRLGGGAAGDRRAHSRRACRHQPSRRLHVRRHHFRDHARGQDGVGVARLPRHGGGEISADLQPASRRVRPRQRHLAAGERRHLHQLPPPQHDRADRQADQEDEMAAPRRQLRHAARLRAAAERQHHAVRQRHQHHRPIRSRA